MEDTNDRDFVLTKNDFDILVDLAEKGIRYLEIRDERRRPTLKEHDRNMQEIRERRAFLRRIKEDRE